MRSRSTMRQSGLSRTSRSRSVEAMAWPSGFTAATSNAASPPASTAPPSKPGRMASSVPPARTGRERRAPLARPLGSVIITATSALSGRVVSGARGTSRVSVARPWSSVSGMSKLCRSGAKVSSARPKRHPRQASKGASSTERRSSAVPLRPEPGAP
jgi:hypothetical protein